MFKTLWIWSLRRAVADGVLIGTWTHGVWLLLRHTAVESFLLPIPFLSLAVGDVG